MQYLDELKKEAVRRLMDNEDVMLNVFNYPISSIDKYDGVFYKIYTVKYEKGKDKIIMVKKQ